MYVDEIMYVYINVRTCMYVTLNVNMYVDVNVTVNVYVNVNINGNMNIYVSMHANMYVNMLGKCPHTCTTAEPKLIRIRQPSSQYCIPIEFKQTK